MLTLRLVQQSSAVGHGSSSVDNAATASASALSTAMVRGGTTGSWQFETAQSTATGTAAAWAAPRARVSSQQQYRGPEQAGEDQGSRQRGERTKKRVNCDVDCGFERYT